MLKEIPLSKWKSAYSKITGQRGRGVPYMQTGSIASKLRGSQSSWTIRQMSLEMTYMSQKLKAFLRWMEHRLIMQKVPIAYMLSM